MADSVHVQYMKWCAGRPASAIIQMRGTMEELTFIFEIIGTIAFAISGAICGLRVKSDLFGVISLGVITATGGGMIRDVILGVTPPSAFTNPVYVTVAAVTGVIVFIVACDSVKKENEVNPAVYRRVLFYMDAIGLGIFTVLGCDKAISLYGGDNLFLCVFSGMITGVGGGLLRDMIVDQLPDIFRKYVYAVASIIGGIVSALLQRAGYHALAIYLPAALIVAVRMLAAHYNWSLPKVEQFPEHWKK